MPNFKFENGKWFILNDVGDGYVLLVTEFPEADEILTEGGYNGGSEQNGLFIFTALKTTAEGLTATASPINEDELRDRVERSLQGASPTFERVGDDVIIIRDGETGIPLGEALVLTPVKVEVVDSEGNRSIVTQFQWIPTRIAATSLEALMAGGSVSGEVTSISIPGITDRVMVIGPDGSVRVVLADDAPPIISLSDQAALAFAEGDMEKFQRIQSFINQPKTAEALMAQHLANGDLQAAQDIFDFTNQQTRQEMQEFLVQAANTPGLASISSALGRGSSITDFVQSFIGGIPRDQELEDEARRVSGELGVEGDTAGALFGDPDDDFDEDELEDDLTPTPRLGDQPAVGEPTGTRGTTGLGTRGNLTPQQEAAEIAKQLQLGELDLDQALNAVGRILQDAGLEGTPEQLEKLAKQALRKSVIENPATTADDEEDGDAELTPLEAIRIRTRSGTPFNLTGAQHARLVASGLDPRELTSSQLLNAISPSQARRTQPSAAADTQRTSDGRVLGRTERVISRTAGLRDAPLGVTSIRNRRFTPRGSTVSQPGGAPATGVDSVTSPFGTVLGAQRDVPNVVSNALTGRDVSPFSSAAQFREAGLGAGIEGFSAPSLGTFGRLNPRERQETAASVRQLGITGEEFQFAVGQATPAARSTRRRGFGASSRRGF